MYKHANILCSLYDNDVTMKLIYLGTQLKYDTNFYVDMQRNYACIQFVEEL